MTETSSFIIQSHNTKNPHYDLTLKKSGEIGSKTISETISWILPRGIPENVREKRIAIEEPGLNGNSEKVTIDLYGEGESTEWDRGDFIIDAENKIKYIFTANGTKLNGKFLLHNPGWGNWTKKKLWVLEKVAP